MLSAAKGLSREAQRCFAALSMTGLDLAGGEELSSSFEPCLNISQGREQMSERGLGAGAFFVLALIWILPL